MKHSGRFFAVGIILSLHTIYLVYYYFRDGQIDIIDLLGYPLFYFIAYWCGKQYDKAQYFSEKDTLTNLYNRRFIMGAFDKIISFADRTNSKLFVLIIDCDNFKEINDSCGHTKGDLVLSNIANILLQSIRKSDVVARWGGDEFLIIGHYKDDAGLQTLIQRLDDQLESLSQQMSLNIKISIGSTIYPDDSNNLEELIKSADQNMYKQKAQNREKGE
ncbi:GGDEF domain-containing protein [Ferdinandcohnia quinoae]|uniref:GGDEF domain-containing protein n=1 Tax=Fredinandcohnia quinoae TaxID=2918902 RepID=A0AAW5E3B7_9BACI|nr:GGDEF domain-containing protein [Fredinandcohnia sp. SECRCQ15]MCH1624486.1 GGDEF domain-containing protein [Fredinandcohnia sp. SECRCQ15]